MNKNIVIVLISTALLFSCSSAKTTTCSADESESCSTVKSKGYKKLSSENKQKIVTLESFNSINNEKINKITGAQLREELKKDSSAVVYFCNYCSAKSKIPETLKEDFKKEEYHKVYFIMEDYNSIDVMLGNNIRPIFSIKIEHYSEKNLKLHKYKKFFINDLLNREIDAKFYKYNMPFILFFKNGRLTSPAFILNNSDYNMMYEILLKELE